MSTSGSRRASRMAVSNMYVGSVGMKAPYSAITSTPTPTVLLATARQVTMALRLWKQSSCMRSERVNVVYLSAEITVEVKR